MDERKRTGNEGEEAVCRYLSERGHQILARNWRAGHLELDIISLDLRGIHFVEVKTRRPPLQAAPQESVRWDKQRNMVKAALSYLRRSKNPLLRDVESHFDVAAVTMIDDTQPVIEYFENAFYPMYT